MMAANSGNTSVTAHVPTVEPPPTQPDAAETSSSRHQKAKVVGLYGVPGSGKTFLLKQLEEELEGTHFAFYEGSHIIASLVPGGLDAFRRMEEEDQTHWRERAIDRIRKDCAASGQVAIVAGHFMFWPEDQEAGRPIYTQKDLATYTHILYFDVPAEIITQRRLNDNERTRPPVSTIHLREWQQEEKTQLRRLCRQHGILFSSVSPGSTLLKSLSTLLHDFRHHTEEFNLSQARDKLDQIVFASQGQPETMLVIERTRHWVGKTQVCCSGRKSPVYDYWKMERIL